MQMKLMIRAHDLGVKGEQNIVDRLEELNLDGIQLVAYKSMDDISYLPGAIGEARAKEAARVLHEKGHEIALLGAYFNPVHPDEEKIKKGIAVFKDYLKIAKVFGCDVVGSETGSYMGEPWVYHPMNHSDEALDRVVDVFGELAAYAKECGVYIGMEGAFGHVCYTPERLNIAIKRIGLDNIRVIFDLYNYLDISNLDNAYEILKRGIELFGDRILLFHVKDFIVEDGKLKQCAVGKGILDYDRILDMIYKHNPDATLVFEGTTGDDIAFAANYIRSKLEKYN